MRFWLLHSLQRTDKSKNKKIMGSKLLFMCATKKDVFIQKIFGNYCPS